MSWAELAANMATTVIQAVGNDVVIDGVSGTGILLSPAQMVLDDSVVLSDYVLEVPTQSWAAVDENTVVSVDGVTYVARERSRPSSDGSSQFVPLVRTSVDGIAVGPSGPFVLDGDWDD